VIVNLKPEKNIVNFFLK